jgi:hypothetical protein
MIKKFEEFINEDIDFRNEYISNIYTQEELEQINEGFKDFVKKFALTAAIATSCLTAMAKPIEVKNPDKVMDVQKEILAKAEKKTKQDCKLFIAKGSSEMFAKQTATNAFNAQFGRRAKILDTQIIKTTTQSGKPLFKCVIIYTE